MIDKPEKPDMKWALYGSFGPKKGSQRAQREQLVAENSVPNHAINVPKVPSQEANRSKMTAEKLKKDKKGK